MLEIILFFIGYFWLNIGILKIDNNNRFVSNFDKISILFIGAIAAILVVLWEDED